MGLYLNQLPQTELARLKAELAETLIANFCYPRFYDYRVNALRMRPVDRAKRQEVWQYLNAVDFNVWGRVDVDSPDFPRQVERLFIHFVQRNRNFFGPQGRRRMVDVRSLITSTSNSFADGLRGHLRGKQENPPFGSPRPISSWMTTNITGRVELVWEQILPGTMQLQQQIQEQRNEIKPASALAPTQQPQAGQVPLSPRPGAGTTGNVSTRRARPTRPATNGTTSNGNGIHENETMVWPSQGNRSGRTSEGRVPTPFAAPSREAEPAFPPLSSSSASNEAAPTLPLPAGKQENLAAAFQAVAGPELSATQQTRPKRGVGKPPEMSSAVAPTPVLDPLRRSNSQPLTSAQALQPTAPAGQVIEQKAQAENAPAVNSDEDVVIFEQLRHQLIVWLRIEVVRAGIELSGQNTFQLVDILRHQDGMDLARLQVVSTLLNMCDQIITSGRATLFDYKQAMMFYLMHTRRSR